MKTNDFPALSFSIDEFADTIFTDWLEQAKYKAPRRLNYDKSEPYEPGEAVRESIVSGWRSIAEKDEERDNPAWCRGFMIGFLQSNLAVKWSGMFLEPGEAYKNAMWLKAILIYLDTFEEPRVQVNRLYSALLDDAIVENPILLPDDLKAHHLVSDLQLAFNWELHRPYLEKHLIQDATKAVHEEKNIDLPDLSFYFSRSQLNELICVNPFM